MVVNEETYKRNDLESPASDLILKPLIIFSNEDFIDDNIILADNSVAEEVEKTDNDTIKLHKKSGINLPGDEDSQFPGTISSIVIETENNELDYIFLNSTP